MNANAPSANAPPDADQRALALDPSLNLIVRAPAGSGKTTLLVERYLRLLAVVDKPESILAITFTRKAAAEMRGRVINALRDGESALAKAAIAADARGQWGLLENPVRLKIQTIDSFAMVLARSLPLHSQYLRNATIAADPEVVYQQAVDELFDSVYQDTDAAPTVLKFLALMDNKAVQARNSVAAMLGRRDLWVRPVMEYAQAQYLQPEMAAEHLAQASDALIDMVLDQIEDAIDPSTRSALFSHIQDTSPWTEGPLLSSECPDRWQNWHRFNVVLNNKSKPGLTKRILTKFVPEKAQREALTELTQTLEAAGHSPVLHLLQHLPWPRQEGTQKQALATITSLLALAVATLGEVFRRDNLADFNELLIAASRALADEQGPTDFALALDYRINHLLIDEFQDTSYSQFRLFELLLAGWDASATDRSFFAVGDPQQSIYRFRGAEVGLFLQTWINGIAGLDLTQVSLSANFRSDAPLVEFTNQTFAAVFGTQTTPTLGQVAHSAAIAQRPAGQVDTAITYSSYPDTAQQAAAVVAQLAHLQAIYPDDTIAVLVRARSHLGPITEQMRQAGLAWQAREIEPLATVAAVNDLTTLHQVLFDPADELAWFALLRSPLCGLTLTELYTVATELRLLGGAFLDAETQPAAANTKVSSYLEHTITWLSQLPTIEAPAQAGLSEDAQRRLWSLCNSLKPWSQQVYEIGPRELLESAWLALAGPGIYAEQQEQALQFFLLLDQLAELGRLPTVLRARTAKLYASATGSAKITLMTIHGAKGLEFEHVIVPNLQSPGRNPTQPLLRWRPSGSGLLLANQDSELNTWLKFEDRARNTAEIDRVFYVACTRAEKSLSLFAVREPSEPADMPLADQKKPDPRSFLARVWAQIPNLPGPPITNNDIAPPQRTPSAEQIAVAPVWGRVALDTLLSARSTAKEQAASSRLTLHSRAQRDHERPVTSATNLPTAQPDADETMANAAVGESDQTIDSLRGTLIHEALQDLTEREGWNQLEDYLTNFEVYCVAMYQRTFFDDLGSTNSADALGAFWLEIERQLRSVAADSTNAWIFQPNPTGVCEFSISGLAPLAAETDTGPKNAIIDRMLVTTLGERWVIDYKTAQGTGNLSAFVQNELDVYRPQLTRYHALVHQYYSEPLRVGIYFTALSRLEELKL